MTGLPVDPGPWVGTVQALDWAIEKARLTDKQELNRAQTYDPLLQSLDAHVRELFVTSLWLSAAILDLHSDDAARHVNNVVCVALQSVSHVDF